MGEMDIKHLLIKEDRKNLLKLKN